MIIAIRCLHCGEVVSVPESAIGQGIKCRYCRHNLVLSTFYTPSSVKKAEGIDLSQCEDEKMADQISDQLSETKSKLTLLYEYEKHYLELIKGYKEEIKFANTLQEDLRRERAQFFTQTLKDVIQTMRGAEIANEVASKWIQELVESYTKSIDLSSDLAKTHVVEILNILTAATKKQVADAGLDNIS